MLLLWSNRPETRGSLSLSLSRYLLQATDDVACFTSVTHEVCAPHPQSRTHIAAHSSAGLACLAAQGKPNLRYFLEGPVHATAWRPTQRCGEQTFGGPLASYEAEHTCAHTDQLCEEAMPMLGAD
jgi:hypothetical protein